MKISKDSEMALDSTESFVNLINIRGKKWMNAKSLKEEAVPIYKRSLPMSLHLLLLPLCKQICVNFAFAKNENISSRSAPQFSNWPSMPG